MIINEILNTVSKENKTIYLFIFIFCLYIFTNIFNITLSTIFGIVISIIIIYWMYDKTKNDISSFNNESKLKLDVLNEKFYSTKKMLLFHDNELNKSSIDIDSYLYTDVNMINFLYSILDFSYYAPDIYEKIIILVNYTLKLKNDITGNDTRFILSDPVGNFEVAERFNKVVINYYHSFIYKIDPSMQSKYTDGMKRFQILLKRNLDDMKKICDERIEKEGINTNTRFINDYDGAKGIDLSEDETSFNLFT